MREKYFSSEVIDYLSIRRQNATNNEKITIEYIYNFSDDDFRVGSCSYLDYVLSKQEKKDSLKDMLIENPFNQVSELFYITNKGNTANITRNITVRFCSSRKKQNSTYYENKHSRKLFDKNDYSFLNSSNYTIVNPDKNITFGRSPSTSVLSIQDLQSIQKKLADFYIRDCFRVVKWTFSERYLNDNSCQLSCSDENSLSLIFNCVFSLDGLKTQNQIREKISVLNANFNEKAAYEKKLSNLLNEKILSLWKHCTGKFVVRIETNEVFLLVQDKDNTANFYRFNQRSDGFKQLICLVFDLIFSYNVNKYNKILLVLDEPECK